MVSWEHRIVTWAAERKIFSGSKPDQQFAKLQEEVEELLSGIQTDNLEEIKDAIGDCSVVLCIVAYMNGLTYSECLEAAWESIKDRKGKMIEGVFVKESDL